MILRMLPVCGQRAARATHVKGRGSRQPAAPFRPALTNAALKVLTVVTGGLWHGAAAGRGWGMQRVHSLQAKVERPFHSQSQTCLWQAYCGGPC
jgi:hypothetical protein